MTSSNISSVSKLGPIFSPARSSRRPASRRCASPHFERSAAGAPHQGASWRRFCESHTGRGRDGRGPRRRHLARAGGRERGQADLSWYLCVMKDTELEKL